MNQRASTASTRLTDQVQLPSELREQATEADHRAWIEVIQRMDDIYADLVNSQVELERKNSQLEDTRRFIESVISSMSDILIVCDTDGTIQQTNQALENCLGMQTKSLKGLPLTVLASEQHHAIVADFALRIRSGVLSDCEVGLVGTDNQEVPMSLNCSARFDLNNRLSGFVITGRPLGELRKAFDALNVAHGKLKTAQGQLVKSEKMASLGRVVAGVAHELNNPISFLFANMHALKGYQTKFKTYIDAIHSGASQSQQTQLRDQLQIDNMMEDIVPLVEGSLEGAERVTAIVQNLRKFSTPQQGSKQQLDLVKVVERALSWASKAHTDKLHVSKDFPTELMLHNNEGHIHQILINLIQNAMDAVKDINKPQIHLAIKQQDNTIQVIVRDNGAGIRDENMVKIFDPFFTTKPVGSGTGLGLYVSFGLATEQCLGDLTAVNHSPGVAFILSLPLEISE